MKTSEHFRFLQRGLSAEMVELDHQLDLVPHNKTRQRKFNLLATTSALLMHAENEEGRRERERQEDSAQSEYRFAFRNFLRYGFDATAREPGIGSEQRRILIKGEQRDMGVGTLPTGSGAFPGSLAGFFAPMNFEDKVESAMKYYGPMLDVATPLDTLNGTPLPYPLDNDVATIGEQVAENTQASAADIPLSQLTFGAYKYSSKLVKMSLEMVMDSGIDLEAYLSEVFGRRIGRALNPKLTTGTGTGQPKGILNGLTASITAAGSATNTGGAELGTNTVGSNDLIALEQVLDPAYRRGSSYMMNDLTVSYVKGLLDKYGRPLNLWRPDFVDGSFGSINGYGVWPNPDFPQMAAGVTGTVLFGRLDKYCVRRAGAMWLQRLSTRFIDTGQIAFILWARRDGALLNPNSATPPVVTLQQHA